MNVWKDKNYADTANNSLKIKVVTHCNYSQVYDEYVFKEFLLYKLYNLISPYSFRVRLLKITYYDTGRNNKSYTRWGFMIEPIESVSKRIDAVQINLQNLGFYHTEPLVTDLFCMWSFMTGFFDWSFTGQHNIKFLKLNDVSKPYLISVPYDFDYSCFVNTDYSVHTEGLGILNVRERIFLDPFRNLEDYQVPVQLLNDKMEDFNH